MFGVRNFLFFSFFGAFFKIPGTGFYLVFVLLKGCYFPKLFLILYRNSILKNLGNFQWLGTGSFLYSFLLESWPFPECEKGIPVVLLQSRRSGRGFVCFLRALWTSSFTHYMHHFTIHQRMWHFIMTWLGLSLGAGVTVTFNVRIRDGRRRRIVWLTDSRYF